MSSSTENAALRWTVQCQLQLCHGLCQCGQVTPSPLLGFILEYVIIAFLRSLKIQCSYIAYTEISVLIILFCLQRKLPHASTQKNPHAAENKTGS